MASRLGAGASSSAVPAQDMIYTGPDTRRAPPVPDPLNKANGHCHIRRAACIMQAERGAGRPLSVNTAITLPPAASCAGPAEPHRMRQLPVWAGRQWESQPSQTNDL